MASQTLSQNKSQQLIRTLQILRKIQTKSESKTIKFSEVNDLQKSISNRMSNLQYIYRKVKADYLVKVFIQKLKRNVRPRKQIKYEQIQDSFILKEKNKDYLKTLILPDLLKSFFILINTLCIFVIQTISLSQAVFFDFQNITSSTTGLKVIKSLLIAQFFIKILLSFTTENMINQSRFKKMKKLVIFYIATLIFVFDFSLFISAILILIFPKSVPVGICAFFISTASFSVLERNLKMIEIVYMDTQRKKQYWAMLKIFFFNVWAIQIFVAIMTSMAHYDSYYNWIQKSIRGKNLIQNPPWYVVYIYAVYWTITTLASLGYGDFTQSNILQCSMMAIIVFFGYIFFAYNVSEVAGILTKLRKINAQRDYDTAIFKRMAKKQRIDSKQIQEKVLNYLQKSSSIKGEYQFVKRKQLLQKLPKKLKQQCMKQASQRIFSNIPFFRYLSQQTLINFSQNIDRHIFYPGQHLTKGSQKLVNIVIVKHGKLGLAMYRPNSSMHGLILQERVINEQIDHPFLINKYLLTRHKQINYKIVAKDFCFLYILNFQTFRKYLAQNIKDNELFFELYNKMEYSDRQWDEFQCQYCSPRRHTVFQCPKLHYMPYKSIVVGKYILRDGESQNRKSNFKRSQNNITKFKKKKSLLFWKRYYKNFSKICISVTDKKITKEQYIQKGNEQVSGKLYLKRSEQKYKNLMEMLNYQFLRNQLDFYDQHQIHIDSLIDKMYNFTYFFTKCNPIHFNQTPLTSSNNIKIDPRYVRNQWIKNTL